MPDRLGDHYYDALIEILQMVKGVDTRKTVMSAATGHRVMTEIRKIIVSVEKEEDRFMQNKHNGGIWLLVIRLG